jgi:catechol-2,3-dioxygenase
MQIIQLILQSKDIVAQRAFYSGLFELPIIAEDSRQVEFQVGYSRLRFEQSDNLPSNAAYHFAFNIPENQIADARHWLGERTPIRTNPQNPQRELFDFPDWNAHAIYFSDPDQNIGELIARHNLDNRSDTPFSEHSLIGVSEVGLATPDVAQTVEGLCAHLESSVWRGAGSDVFSAVGDEHGLFIVVRTGRQWLGSSTSAHPLPTTVIVADISHDYDVPGMPFHVRRS